jgi:hypothetical protein
MFTTAEKNKSVATTSASTVSKTKVFEILLRIGIFGTFLGHGIFALIGKADWIPLITAFGFSENAAVHMMPVIGGLDIIVAVATIFHPYRAVAIWAAFWAFMTALARPIAGAPIWDFVERASNWMLPLALLWMKGFPTTWKELWQR